MSKPKPGLGKGLVRTLAQHPSTSTSSAALHHPLQLAPVVSQHGYSSYTHTKNLSTSSILSTFPSASSGTLATSTSLTNGRPLIPATTPSYLSLLPTWESPNLATFFSSDSVNMASRLTSDALAVVLPYRGTTTLSSRMTAPVAVHAFGPRNLRTSTSKSKKSTRRGSASYTTSSAPTRAMALDPGFFQMFNSAFLGPMHPGPSVPPSLLAFEKGSMFASYQNSTFEIPLNDFSLPPPPPPSPSPGQPQTMRPSRSSETHTVLSPAPPAVNTDSGPSPSVASSSQTSLLFEADQSTMTDPSETTGEPTDLKVYSSSLIFHLGASGSAKERSNKPVQNRDHREPPPTRQRAFPLPEVTPPPQHQLRSVGVGEDAYFTRFDGMCIADGVGGWAKSGRGGADAGRWSRLLTHFCEVEVDDWWAGSEGYVMNITSSANAKIQEKGRAYSTTSDPNVGHEGTSGPEWAKNAWKKSVIAARLTDDTLGLESGQKRRPLNPVEIMQKGFEKCLACVTAEGVHGSSTCLLALLHHSTLLIANIGDCSLLLIRRGEVIFRTTEMQHSFNFPMQLGTHSKDEPMKDAKRYDVGVERGDVVVVGSDGLMDNLFEHEILRIVSEFAPPIQSSTTTTSPNLQLPTPPASRPSTPTPPPFLPQQVSEALCKHARYISEQRNASTPFMERAIKQGIDYSGGKKDDISVLVGVVGDRETPAASLAEIR